MKFQIIDAFSENIFGGNPAGVVLLEDGHDFPEKSIMLKTAAELRYSETAFIKTVEKNHFHIRFFTPTDEVDLCGHATIGSFGALMEWGIISDGQNCVMDTLAGRLNVEISDGLIFMDMSEPVKTGVLKDSSEIEELADIMGVKAEDITMTPELISTGLPDLMMAVKSKAVLESIKPDFLRLSEFSERYRVVGVHSFTLESGDSEVTAHCRNFAPLYGIDEEAATGTSTGAMTFYLYEKGFIKTENTNCFIQGEAMGRPSKVMSKLFVSDGKVKIQVGGVYKKLAQGEIFI